jgi:hypothetical protein
MPIIKRLDHVILAARDRRDWVTVFDRVLGLTPERMIEDHLSGWEAFNNATFLVGDGFIGIVEPSGEESVLHRFLARFGDGFYGMSVGVSDVSAAEAALERQGVDHRTTSGLGFLWAGPRRTHGVLFEVVSGGTLTGSSPNPFYVGITRLTVAVSDLDQAIKDYSAMWDLVAEGELNDDPPGTRGAEFPLSGSTIPQRLVLVEPSTADGPVADHLRTRGEGMYSFTIGVTDLDAAVSRVRDAGVECTSYPGRAVIPPESLLGLRVELAAVST